MTAKIIVVINVVIKNFFAIFGFFGAPGSIPPIFSLKTSLFDWMQAFCFLDYVSECDQLVKSYYSDLVKIKDYVGVRWVKSVGRKR